MARYRSSDTATAVASGDLAARDQRPFLLAAGRSAFKKPLEGLGRI